MQIVPLAQRPHLAEVLDNPELMFHGTVAQALCRTAPSTA